MLALNNWLIKGEGAKKAGMTDGYGFPIRAMSNVWARTQAAGIARVLQLMGIPDLAGMMGKGSVKAIPIQHRDGLAG